ncbi:hypothetical protein ACFL1R_07115 [Candidatus Latescibacterota bacterium]
MHEYQSARVDFTLTEEGYERYIVDLYPDKLAIVDMLLHAIWIILALFFAFRMLDMSLLGTVGTSLGGILLALLIGKFMPLGFLLGGAALFFGIVALPYHVVAGPLGLYGLNSLSKRLSKWYGRDFVKRWCIGTEEQFLGAVADRTIIVTANRYATKDTRLFLKQLAEAVGLDEMEWEEA